MRKVKISEFAEVITGGTPSTSVPEYWDNGTIPWLQSGACQNCIITGCNTFITQAGLDNSAAKLMKPDSVLIALTGATTGKVGYLTFEACANQSVTGIQPNEQFVPKYLYYYLLGIRQKILDDSYGGAQKHISQGYVKNLEIPLGTIEEQRSIVEKLEHITQIISFRQQELQKIDALIKARFVEMFGDMLINPKGLPEQRLDSLADIVSGITKGRKIKTDELYEVPYMAVSNVKDGYIDWSTVKTIMATGGEIDQYRLMPGDVLMTEGGDPDKLGRGAIIHEPPKDCIHQNHIFRVRLKHNILLSIFMAQYLQQQKAKRYFLRCAKQTTGIASINMKQLSALPVLVPPMKEQKEYASFVAQVDKSKVAVQNVLDEA